MSLSSHVDSMSIGGNSTKIILLQGIQRTASKALVFSEALCMQSLIYILANTENFELDVNGCGKVNSVFYL